jgi:hypothetical protein
VHGHCVAAIVWAPAQLKHGSKDGVGRGKRLWCGFVKRNGQASGSRW